MLCINISGISEQVWVRKDCTCNLLFHSTKCKSYKFMLQMQSQDTTVFGSSETILASRLLTNIFSTGKTNFKDIPKRTLKSVVLLIILTQALMGAFLAECATC